MLSTWPKDGHSVGKLYAPPSLFMQLVFFSRSRSTSWPAWFSDVFLFPKFWHLTNDMIFFRYVICYGRLVHFCCPALSVWPCERSVANRFYSFPVFLLSFPIISASLSYICTVAVVAWNPVHTFSSMLYCALIFWVVLKKIVLVFELPTNERFQGVYTY